MKNKLLAVMAVFCITACGGGSGDNSPQQAQTYFQHNGLIWSTPSPKLYEGYTTFFTESANYYCSGNTNGVPNNFNKEAGWRLPTFGEVWNLYKEAPNKTGVVTLWANDNTAVRFSDGTVMMYINTPLFANVSCVKRA